MKKSNEYLETSEGSLNLWRHVVIIVIWISPLWLVLSGKKLVVGPMIWLGLILSIVGVIIALPLNAKFMGRMARLKVFLKDGPFKYCRNPFYLGQTLYMIGLAMALYCWQNVVAGIVLLVLTHLTVLKEEEKLTEKFGRSYLNYKRQTPRYFPKDLVGFFKSIFVNKSP
ncbi:MAG: methyltransferase [Patescibacteria group bacterium]|jgi:protein-S-isoprenylcysteine O-methyltransferase Ste14